MTSFISTSSCCRLSFLNSDLTRPMISDARVTSLTTLEAAACASAKSGQSRVSHREQVRASVIAAEIGCLISCDNEAASSPMVLTRFRMCETGQFFPHSLALLQRRLQFVFGLLSIQLSGGAGSEDLKQVDRARVSLHRLVVQNCQVADDAIAAVEHRNAEVAFHLP